MASIYIANEKEKGNSKETKYKNSKRVRKVEKWETGQGSKYKAGKGFKPKKKTRTYKRDEYGHIIKGKKSK